MDRKTLFSSLFAATVVAGAAVKTAVDPDLRRVFFGMPQIGLDARIHPDSPLDVLVEWSPTQLPTSATLTPAERNQIDAELASPNTNPGFTAKALTIDDLDVRLRQSCPNGGREFWQLRLHKENGTVAADLAGLRRASDGAPHELRVHAAQIKLNSLNWAPGRDVYTHLVVELTGDENDEPVTMYVGGSATIQPPD